MELLKEGTKFFIFILLIAGVTIAVHFTSLSEYVVPSQIKAFVTGFGNISIVAFIIITSLATAVSFPLLVFIFVGAILFGVWKGMIANTIGAFGGAVLGFYLAKISGREFVQRLSGERFSNMQNAIKEKGFTIIFIWRLIPIIPFPLINFAAGLSQIRFIDYFLATAIGQIPGTFIVTYVSAKIGERLLNGQFTFQELLSADLIIAILVFVAFIVLPILYHRKYHIKEPKH